MDSVYQNIGKIIFSDINLASFIVFMMFAYIGLAGNLLSDFTRRNKHSKSSPAQFSLAYWWADNKYRLLLSLLSTPLFILIFNELFGIQVSKLIAVLIGISTDHIWEILKRKNIIANADTNKAERRKENDTDSK